MKAAVLYESPGQLQVEDIVIDDPQPNEIIIQIAASGLCHSDLHWLDRGYPMPKPIVLGHEAAGIVARVGSEVSKVQVGDHVIGYNLGSCGDCEWCRSDRKVLCTRVGVRRDPSDRPRLSKHDGTPIETSSLAAFAEQMLVHESQAVIIDKDIAFDIAAMVGCGVPTGFGAVTRRANVYPNATVAVIGCGGIGLNAIQAAVLAGASRVIAIDVNDGKLELARQFGATDVINSSTGDVLKRLGEILPGRGGVDFSFEAIGKKATYELAFEILRPGGLATVIGVYEGDIQLPAQLFWSGERAIQGSLMGSLDFQADLPRILELYQQGRLKLEELISNRIPLEQINEGYAEISKGSVARSVVMFDV
jgi:S-(hydroxymethyl)glutathione dehydrogenase / alcohol dehydrogenase